MKEKPDVTWDQVIGLDDAKSALRESIVYPTKRPDLFPLGMAKGNVTLWTTWNWKDNACCSNCK